MNVTHNVIQYVLHKINKNMGNYMVKNTYYYMYKRTVFRRITNGNCSPPIRAVRATKNRSRAIALGAVLSPPHFASPGLAAQALIRAGKTSVTLNVK